jgi:lambda repressor-like predicted transcriptional regulator
MITPDDFMDDEFILHPEVLEYGPRQAAQELLRAQVETDARRGNLDSPALRSRLRIARNVGVAVIDLQRRTGLARQTIYNAIKRPVGELEELAALALIAAGSSQTIEALAGVTGAGVERVRRTVSQLHHAGYVNVLAGQAGSSEPVAIFSVTATGLDRLRKEIDSERLRSTHDDAWTMFIAIEESKVDAIEAAAKELLGDDNSFGLINAAVSPSMHGPELAVVVRAIDSREAFTVTGDVWAQLTLGVAELPLAPQIVELSQPRRP